MYKDHTPAPCKWAAGVLFWLFSFLVSFGLLLGAGLVMVVYGIIHYPVEIFVAIVIFAMVVGIYAFT